MPVFIHHLSDVQTSSIGDESRIWQFTVVLPGAHIGKNCNINAHCFIENDVIIGNNVTIKCGVQIWNGITLEDDVFIGPNTAFTNDFYPRSKMYPREFPKTLVKKGASIGANSTILPGLTIGEYAMIGAGSVVTKNIPSHTLYYGNPAKFHGVVCTCGRVVNKHSVCPYCGKSIKIRIDYDTVSKLSEHK